MSHTTIHVGTRLILNQPAMDVDGETDEERHVPAGETWEVTMIDVHRAPTVYHLSHPETECWICLDDVEIEELTEVAR